MIGIALIVVALIVIIVAVSRIPSGVPSSRTNTTPPHETFGHIGIVVEVPAPSSTTSSTSSTTGSTTSSTVAGASTSSTAATTTTAVTTTVPPAAAGIVAELRARGYVIEKVIINPNPPPTTQIHYLHKLGSIRAAVAIADLMGLGRTAVSAYSGSAASLPPGTNVIIVLGTTAA
jgi:hypothetical protein